MLAKGSTRQKERIRPKNLDLLQFRFPVTSILSILHRVSGVYLVLCLPLLLYLLDVSLRGPHGFNYAQNWFDSTWGRIVAGFGLWSLLHHFLAGIRFLLIELDIGVDVRSARKSARAVIFAALVFTLILGAMWL